MAYILSIETSEKICSVALSNDKIIIGSLETELEKSHASQLTVLIDNLCKNAGLDISTLEAVAVSKGPGSYTGLRIGVSVAKGICFGLNIPLIALNTLYFLKSGIHQNKDYHNLLKENENLLICSMIDARRMEVYRALQKDSGELVGEIVAEEITSISFDEYLSKENLKVIFIGSGADKCKHLIHNENAHFIENIRPQANQMVTLAHEYFDKKIFENLAYFEPYYLKDFVATTSKKRLVSF